MKYRIENTFSGNYLYMQGENENDEECKYDVTEKISLTSAYKEVPCTYEMIYALIETISREGKRIEAENLDLNGLILNPKYIFIDLLDQENISINKFHIEQVVPSISIYYYSGNTGLLFQDELLKLAEFIIENADYKDRDTIDIAYGFYLKVFRHNYLFDDLLK